MPESEPVNIPDLLGLFQEQSPHLHHIRPEHIPEPYHTLLVHDWDMTPTLAEFHQSPIALRIVDWEKGVGQCSRRVVLLDKQQIPVEYGAIIIHTDHLPEPAATAVFECRQPLGTILEEHDVDHDSHPFAFFKVTPDIEMRDALLIDGHTPLFGRFNRITTPAGLLIAEVIEILPPVK